MHAAYKEALSLYIVLILRLVQGNTTGDVYVYDTADGKRMTHVAPIKVSAPVRACGLSPDCRHLLAVIGNGFIFRFEYRKPDVEVSHWVMVNGLACLS